MKRKIIISTVSIAASMFLLGGCYSLDLSPDYQLSAGTFWKTEDHARQGIIAVYQMFQNDYVTGLIFTEDLVGDICNGYDLDCANLAKGTINSTSGYVSNKWAALYEGIARANIVIQNVSKMDVLDDAQKALYIGEAKFLRAYFYNMLLNYYGGVPYYDENCVVAEEFSEMKEPRSSADEIRNNIITDLDAAIAVLPEYGSEDDWTGSNYGRATKGAAQALKAKVLLYNKQYSEAKAIFAQIVSSKLYDLYPSYPDLFLPGGDESSEMIFAIQSMGGVGTDYGVPTTFRMGTRSSYGSCWDNCTLSTSFVDSYENIDGTPFNWEDWFPGFTTDDSVKEHVFHLKSGDFQGYELPEDVDKLLDMYDHRDPRMAWTAILPYTHYLGWNANAERDMLFIIPKAGSGNENYGSVRINNGWKVYLFRKFVAEGNMNGQINNRADTPINFPLIRYADVLLMYAECLNETGDRAAAAVEVNKVRRRAGMPDLAASATATKDAMFKAIKHEREVEMAGEGHSYMDHKRWGLLTTLNGKEEKDLIGVTKYKHTVLERDYLLPIPNAEIEKNSALTQNPGW